jgi:hypothetical protein
MASTFGTDPMASYFTTVQADQASKDPTKQLIGNIGALEAPTIAGQELQFAGIEQQMADAPAALKQQSDYATALAGYQQGRLGIQNQQTGLSQQGTEQQHALTVQSQAEQEQKNALNYTRQLQGSVQNSAASGVLGTGGAVQAQGDIGQQAWWAQADLGRQEQLTAGDYARAEQNYALMAKANGLSAAEVKTRLGQGIDQLGQQYDPATIAAQAGNVLSSSSQGIGQVLSEVGSLTNTNMLSWLGG